jgi:hypothetical protein
MSGCLAIDSTVLTRWICLIKFLDEEGDSWGHEVLSKERKLETLERYLNKNDSYKVQTGL